MELAACFGTSPDPVAFFVARDRKTFENDAFSKASKFLQVSGVDLESLVARALSGEPASFEWGDVGPGGVRCWYAATISPVREQDRVTGALAIAKDVTALKRTEERLRRSEQMLVDTQGVAHLGTWEWDVSLPNATWSTELYRIYGLTPEEYTPSYEAYLTKIHPDDRQRVMDATNRVFHEHVPYSHDERIFRPDGSMRYLHTWAFPVLDDTGKLLKLVGVCQDITDRKMAEEEVLSLNATLEKRVEERMRDIEAFHVMVSHDLRAPLSVISGSCMLLEEERGHLPSSTTRNVERIARAAKQMTHLVNDLVELAQVGNTKLDLTEIDLSAQCEEIVSGLRVGASGVSSTIITIEPGLKCRGDAVLVRRALENLIGNAWKYSARAASPRVEIGETKHDGKPAFYVRDNGVGFDMKDAERIFAPFERLHKAEFEGTGVGLAAVRRIIERHGGRIWVQSAPNEGAAFFFTLTP